MIVDVTGAPTVPWSVWPGGKFNGEQVEFLYVLGSGVRFYLRVADHSLAEDGISKGDYIICEKQQFDRDGNRVVTQVDGKQTVLKGF